MPSTSAKPVRLQRATSEAQAFLDAGVDLNGEPAVPVELELARACGDPAQRFVRPILQSVERPNAGLGSSVND